MTSAQVTAELAKMGTGQLLVLMTRVARILQSGSLPGILAATRAEDPRVLQELVFVAYFFGRATLVVELAQVLATWGWTVTATPDSLEGTEFDFDSVDKVLLPIGTTSEVRYLMRES